VAERQDSDREVLTSLPRTRPVRRSAKRGDPANAEHRAVSAPSRGAPAKPRKAKATAGANAPATKKAAPKAAAKATPRARPTAARSTTPKAPGATAHGAEHARTAPRRKVPPAGYAAPSARADDGGGSGTADLLSTTIQAAAELAQIGFTVGRQTLQSMLDRLPKP